MTGISPEELACRALDAGLLTTSQLETIWDEFGSRQVPLPEFIMFVVRRGFLTNDQISRLTEEKCDVDVVGLYKVLYMVRPERLARVYRAIHKETRQVVTVKVLRSIYSNNSDALDEFSREARQLACQVETAKGRLYMVLDGSRN